MSEGSNDFLSRGARGIFGPPCEHMSPHANDGLGQHIWVETISGASVGDGLATSGTYAACQTFEDLGTDFAGLCAGMKHDAEQVSLILCETDEGFRLALHDFDRIGHVFGCATQARLEFGGGLLSQLAKECKLVLEVQVEGAGGVTSLFGDDVARDGMWAKFYEELTTGIKQPTTGGLGSRHARFCAA